MVVFAALSWEAHAALDGLQGVEPIGARAWRGYLGDGAAVRVLQTGMGPLRARSAAEAAPPARVFLSCGCAGALIAELAPGDMVLGSRIAVLEERGLAGNDVVLEPAPIARWAATRGARLRVAPIASSPVMLADAAAKADAAGTGAVVVEMESAAVAAVARARAIPCAVVKVVLDELGVELGVAGGTLVDGATGDLDVARALAHIAIRPHRWPAAVRLARAQRIADRRLREFLAILFSAGLDAFGLAPGTPQARAG